MNSGPPDGVHRCRAARPCRDGRCAVCPRDTGCQGQRTGCMSRRPADLPSPLLATRRGLMPEGAAPRVRTSGCQAHGG